MPLAKKMAKSGKKVALIEKRWLGGTCVNDGCTPTKTWVASARASYMAETSAKLGVPVEKYHVNLHKIKARKDQVVNKSRTGLEKSLGQIKKLDIIYGKARFVGPKKIAVTMSDEEERVLDADLVFINAGTRPFIPPIEGLDSISYLTSTTILDLKKIPGNLLILGGNYIGLEYGQMFRRFGSKVTIVEKSARIMSREDSDVSSEIEKLLSLESIHFLKGAKALRFEQKKKDSIIVTIKKGSREMNIACTHVLIATGRIPQTDDLQLENTGVKTDDKGYIEVNSKLETNIKGIYALGDINGGPAFTHISYHDYTIVYRNLLENGRYSTRNRLVPYCMFTDPQLGRIGISESEAKEKGIAVKIAKMPLSSVARAVETGNTHGFLKALVDPVTKKILGAAFLSADGGELMSLLQMAMEGGLTYDKLAYGVFAHPLYAEALNNLFLQLEEPS